MALFERFVGWVRIFLVWLVGFALTLSILALLHDLLLVFVATTLGWERDLARFLNMLYYVPAGVAAIAYLAFVYPYLQKARGPGQFMRGTRLLLGSQLLAIGLIQLGLIGYRYLPASPLNVFLALAEALAGVVFLGLARRQPKSLVGASLHHKERTP